MLQQPQLMGEAKLTSVRESPATADEMWAAIAKRLAEIERRLEILEKQVTGARPPESEPATLQAGASYDLEHRFASPLLNYLGLIALLVGLALLIGYWMEERSWAAILMAGASAGALAGAAQWMRRHGAETFSLTLEGTALGLVYIACYLSWAWGGIVLSLATAVGVMVIAMRRAIHRDSQLVAAFALLAALLGTLLLRSVHSGASLLFGYLAAVNGGALWAGRRKNWIGLRFLALIGSHLVAWFWYWSHPAVQPALTAAFPIFTFLLFAWFVPAGPLTLPEITLAIMNSGAFLAASASLLRAYSPEEVAWSPLALASVHLVIGVTSWYAAPFRRYAVLHLSIAAFLFAIGVMVAVPAAGIAVGWTVEGFLLGWIGLRRNSRVLRSVANLLGLGAAVAIQFATRSPNDSVPPNLLSLVTLGFAISIAARHLLAKRYEIHLGNWEWATHWMTACAATILPMLALSQLVSQRGPALLSPSLATSAVWAAYSMGICLAGWFRISGFLRWMGVTLLLITTLKVFLIDPATLSGITRVASFLLLSLVLLLLSYLFQTRRP